MHFVTTSALQHAGCLHHISHKWTEREQNENATNASTCIANYMTVHSEQGAAPTSRDDVMTTDTC